MATMLVTHEIEDVERWLRSPKRNGVVGPLGFTVHTFVDPTDAHRVGLLLEGPSIEAFDEMMKTDAAADAMKHDGVRPDPVRVLVQRGAPGGRARLSGDRPRGPPERPASGR